MCINVSVTWTSHHFIIWIKISSRVLIVLFIS